MISIEMWWSGSANYNQMDKIRQKIQYKEVQ